MFAVYYDGSTHLVIVNEDHVFIFTNFTKYKMMSRRVVDKNV